MRNSITSSMIEQPKFLGQDDVASTADEVEPHFPLKDLITLAFIRFAEPISFTSINPYLFFMIQSFGKEEKDIGFYAGLIASSFPLAEFATGVFWGRLSDKIGRKRVILICLAGCILPTLLFGFSKSITEAVVWRTLTGLINGNAPVIATACAELVTYKPLAFSIVPITWSIGSILGPILGGLLSDPVAQYPSLFHGTLKEFFLAYRFALPNMVSALMFLVALGFGIALLKETRQVLIPDDEPILNETTPLARRQRRTSALSVSATQGYEPAIIVFPPTVEDEDDDDLACDHGYGTISTSIPTSSAPVQLSLREESKQFTLHIYLYLTMFAVLCFHQMSSDQIFPIFCSTSPENGGLSLTSGQVGLVYAICSIVSLAMQALFPLAHRYLGSIGCIRLSCLLSIMSYLIVPFLVLIPRGLILYTGCIIVVLGFRAASILGYPAITILLTNAVPKPSAKYPTSILGTVNGLSQSVGSAARGLGPLLIGPTFALSLSAGASSFIWILLVILALIVFAMTKWKSEESLEHE